MSSEETLRRAIIDTAAGKTITSTDPLVQQAVEETRAIIAAGGIVDIAPEITEVGPPEPLKLPPPPTKSSPPTGLL